MKKKVLIIIGIILLLILSIFGIWYAIDTNRTNNTNNSSVYNNTNSLPKTGVTDSIPVAVLLIVFAISAAYAYKKIKDYKNI